MIGFSCLFAYKRGEIKAYWTGYFYDILLLNPFAIQNFQVNFTII